MFIVCKLNVSQNPSCFFLVSAPWWSKGSGISGPMSQGRRLRAGPWDAPKRTVQHNKRQGLLSRGQPSIHKSIKNMWNRFMGDRFITGLSIQTQMLSLPGPLHLCLSQNCCQYLGSDSGRQLAGKNPLAAAGAKNNQRQGKEGDDTLPPESPSLSPSILFVTRGTELPTCQRSRVD